MSEKEIIELVLKAYEELCGETILDVVYIPKLEDIYDEFYLNVMDAIAEKVFEVYGEDYEFTDVDLIELGIDMSTLPKIDKVAEILNMFNCGYIYDNKLFNMFQMSLF